MIKSLHTQLINKEISATELAKDYLARAHGDQEKLGAYITVTDDTALSSAARVDADIAAGKDIHILAGIPYSLKDIITTEGIRSTGASKILDTFVPPYSATVATKLADASATLVGKNNCDEFAQGGSNENSAYGAVLNPHDQSRVAGGSSGGSAAAVASGSSVFSIGTDTGGSIRQPAAFCGAVGLKVTYGRTSRFGVMSMASSFDTIGPITQTVEDAAIVLETIAGQDPHDPTTLHAPAEQYTGALHQDLHGKVIGLPKEYFTDDVPSNIKDMIMDRVRLLEGLGATCKEISLPMTKYAIATYYVIVPAEVSANMSRYDGLRYGPTNPSPHDLDELYVSNRTGGFGKEVKRRIMIGNYVLSHGYYDAYYKKAQQVRTKIIQEFATAFQSVDAMITPVAPMLPFKIGEKQDPLDMYLADIFTIPSAAAGLPGLSVPIGEIDGLPVGLQILGPQLGESTILGIGHQLEQAMQ